MTEKERFDYFRNMIEKRLTEPLSSLEYPDKTLVDSMKYSLEVGGKRIRPVILLEFNRLCGGKTEDALPFALAIEYIHTYSLIHDDLPCMDNDDFRRGKPSNHKVFGEACAVLSGDALLNLAFEVMLGENDCTAPPELRMRAASTIAAASGACGMVGGQAIDMSGAARIDQSYLERMDSLKTGAILRAAGIAGCILAGAGIDKIEAAKNYCNNIGLAFQIRDDMLDILGDEDILGKPVGSDAGSGKVTYVDILGLDGCSAEIERLTVSAINALKSFEDHGILTWLALTLSERTK